MAIARSGWHRMPSRTLPQPLSSTLSTAPSAGKIRTLDMNSSHTASLGAPRGHIIPTTSDAWHCPGLLLGVDPLIKRLPMSSTASPQRVSLPAWQALDELEQKQQLRNAANGKQE